ncbi:MAG: DNA topoisomerase VI subunit B [Candidatus Micrarchaeota archaeon]
MADVNIHKDFQEHSIAEFFKKNRQMLGYSGKIKSLTTVVHEYVTNSVDACEEAGILPEIYVKLERHGPEHFKVIVEDNGPGMSKNIVPKAFGTMLAGTKFHRFQQARGQQGIGGSGCIMFSQVTTGKPTKVITSQGKGTVYECNLSIDVKANAAQIQDPKEYSGHMKGTRLESEIKDVKYQKGEYSVDEYLRRTALANPHVKITYIDPENLTTVYDRAVGVIPKKAKPTQPHPKGVGVDDIMSLSSATKARTVSSFLTTELTRFSSHKAKEMQGMITFDINKRPQDLRWNEAEEIVKAFEKMSFIAPPTDCLIPIGEKHLEKALDNILKPDFKTILERPASIYRGGVPFIIEVALAYGGKSGKLTEEEATGKSKTDIVEDGLGIEPTNQIEIMRFSNRVPLLFDAGGCAITKAVNSVEWKRYKLNEGSPMSILINFTSVHVPYTGAGKESIADDEEVTKEIRLALMDAGRRLGQFVSGQRKQYERTQKIQTLLVYIQPVAEALAKITGEKEDILIKKMKAIVETKYTGSEDEDGESEEGAGEEENGEENGDDE